MLYGIREYSISHDPWAFYYEEPFYEKRRFHTIEQIIEWGPDGIITRNWQDAQKIRDSGIPVIVAIHMEEPLEGIPSVVGDNEAMGKLAAEYLISRGFKNFAFFGFDDMFWSRQREEAFVSAIGKSGYKCLVAKFSKIEHSNNTEIMLLSKWLDRLHKPVGILTCNDDRARQLIEASKMADVIIPDQVAILGIDNDELICDLSYPTISSVSLNIQHAGYEVAKLLDAMMNGYKPIFDKIIVTPISVIDRMSTDVFHVQDEEVCEALKFINEHSSEMIQVEDVAKAVGISKRALQMRFMAELGYSIFERIKKVKVEQMARLLINTNMSVHEIAIKLGFANINNVSRYFKIDKGISPREYRKAYR